MVHEVALLGQPHEFPYNSKRDKMKIRLYYIRVPARYRPLCEDNNTYYYHTEAFVRRHARGGKIYLGVVDIAHSGGVLLCKNIVIPAVVLRNKFCEPSIMCEEKNTTWCKLKQKTHLFFRDNTQHSAYVSLPMGRAWISATRTVDNTARRREISIAKHCHDRIFFTIYYLLLNLITS